MAMNWQVFRTRAGTALVFVAVMLVGLLWNPLSFFVLFSIVHFGCWHEFQKLAVAIQPLTVPLRPAEKYGYPLAGWLFMLSNYYPFTAGYVKTGDLLVLAAGALVLLLSAYTLASKNGAVKLRFWLGGMVYISVSLGLLVNLRNIGITRIPLQPGHLSDYGRFVPCIIIFSIWINDTMAYISGSLFGKTPFSKISPKKTWEGTAGGAILCVAAMYAAGPFVFDHQEHRTALVPLWAAIAAIAGTVGDLFESWLKRKAGVKDSGRIMPGHGGFLDRFDSLLFAVPIVWLVMQLLGYKT
jgi:phosphatidate cytidylyltransferase